MMEVDTSSSAHVQPEEQLELPTFLAQALIASEPNVEDEETISSSTSDRVDDLSRSSPPSLLVPPLNFQNVAYGISRSGHPNERNYEFIKHLKLKSIMYIVNEDYRPSITQFIESEKIKLLHHKISINKEPFGEMEHEIVCNALSDLLDTRNYPILIHCNKGKYRVGCLIGLLRRLQGWSHTSIFEEFARFAGVKAIDEEFIEVFDLSQVKIDPQYKPHWL
ncbi:unnamed protein product [Sympodiomycopsis kandeliae]